MAISRPFLLALLGAALLGATFFAVQSARDNSSNDAAPAAQGSQSEGAPAPSEPVNASSPEEAIASSLNGDIQSASFDARLSASGGDQSGSLRVNGAFEQVGRGEVPEFEVYVKLDALGSGVDAGIVSTGERAYIVDGDRAYRVPQSAWNQVQQAAAEAKTPTEQVELPFTVNPQNWLRDVKEEDSETIEGVETTHVSAALDVPAMMNDLMAAAQQTGGAAAQLPPELGQQAADAVKRADFDVYVGKQDDILRRAVADVEVAPQGGQALKLSADVNLTRVNEPQDIDAPKDVVAGVPDGPVGQLAQGFLASVGATEAARASSLAALATRNPQKAARAVRDNKKVVIFFRNPRGIDDRAVMRSVRAVDANTKAVVLTDHVDTVERYGKVVEELGVSQAPSIVIIDRSGDARLIEGYVDTASLTQAVADAR